jgi:phosphonopyruvate decarboxylase
MIDPKDFLTALKDADIRFVTGVPDSLLKDVCACITAELGPEGHVIAANEGAAVALAIGHHLASGRPALVYMQNSGLGNTINPLASLADPAVYAIPMVLMIGWRGEIQPDGTQLKDEPQHVKQGQVTLAQLDVMGVHYRIIDSSSSISEVINDLTETALERSGPVALVVRKGTFAQFKLEQPEQPDEWMGREEAIGHILSLLPEDAIVVSTTGMASREVFELRKGADSGHHRDFLTVGGMGHASQIATGIALTKPDRTVVCIDGDGAVLMHAGSLAISADCPNLLHIVLNNAAHDSVGGQPTKGGVLRFDRIAKEFGYTITDIATTEDDLYSMLPSMLETQGSRLLEVLCQRGSRKDLGRPTRTPKENKQDFMTHVSAE